MRVHIITEEGRTERMKPARGGCEGLLADDDLCTGADDVFTLETVEDPDANGMRHCVPCLISEFTDVVRIVFEKDDEDLEFHDTGMHLMGNGQYVPDCECGWQGDMGTMEEAYAQREAHEKEMER